MKFLDAAMEEYAKNVQAELLQLVRDMCRSEERRVGKEC